MPFVSRREVWKGRGGKQNDKNENESDRMFVVTMSSAADDEYSVATTALIPSMFEPHPSRPGLWVSDIDIRNMDESAYLWICHVHYSDNVEDPEQKKDTPLDKPIKDSYGHNSYTLPATEGWLIDPDTGIESSTKTAIVSSAGEAFDPPEERNASRISIAMELNLANVPSWLLEYNDVINDDAVTIRGITFPKYTLRINTRISELQIEKGIPYRQVLFDLESREETFLKRIPDRGFVVRNGSSTKQKATVGGMEPSQPVYLDGKGRHAGNAECFATAGSPNCQLALYDAAFLSGEFENEDIGQPITIFGAGTGGEPHVSTIISISKSGVSALGYDVATMADNAVTTVSRAAVEWVVGRQRFRMYRADKAKPFGILNLPAS